jgi:CO/xanthine dehydrogenase Mo-binding subunit
VKELGIVGHSIRRRDGIGHVTGTTRYVDDVSYPGMLWLKAVRSPVARGVLRGVDTSKAEALPGVATVVTAKDVPNNWYTILCLIGVGPLDEPVLADTEVMWEGEPICAVVAEREDVAVEAAALVELDIEEQEPVLDLEYAVTPDAPAIKKWGSNLFPYDGIDQQASRRRRGRRLRERRCDRRGRVHAAADRARADRDARVRGQARGRRPAHRAHQHPGAVLHARQHRNHPGGPFEPNTNDRGYRGRGVRREGRRDHGAAFVYRRPEDGAAGQVALHAQGGVHLLLDPFGSQAPVP